MVGRGGKGFISTSSMTCSSISSWSTGGGGMRIDEGEKERGGMMSIMNEYDEYNERGWKATAGRLLSPYHHIIS